MEELVIGEETTINGHRVKCVEDSDSCHCYNRCSLFNDFDCSEIPCSSYERADGKNVHFELVEE